MLEKEIEVAQPSQRYPIVAAMNISSRPSNGTKVEYEYVFTVPSLIS
jgi:hypothetical protein